jgi:hypothetical protein
MGKATNFSRDGSLRAVTMRNGRQGVSALLAALTASATAPHAFASGHMPGGPLTLVALFWSLLPVIVPWTIGLGTLLGRPSGLKFMFGFSGSLLATVVCFLAPDDGTSFSSLFVFGGVLGGLALVAHVVRFTVHVFARATGGRSKEVLKEWWRYL